MAYRATRNVGFGGEEYKAGDFIPFSEDHNLSCEVLLACGAVEEAEEDDATADAAKAQAKADAKATADAVEAQTKADAKATADAVEAQTKADAKATADAAKAAKE
jgi:hypothetical protein